MQLYHNPLSSNSRRVAMMADHLGIELDLVHIDLATEAGRRKLNEVNPNSKIPVLVHGDFVLWESCAIMQFLADGTPGNALYPQDPKVRADINRWMFWGCQHFATAVRILVWENVWKKFVTGSGPDLDALARGAAELAQVAEVLDDHLAGQPFLVGQAVTLADYAVVAPLMYKEKARLPVEDYPHLMAWLARMQALPAWQHTEPRW